MRYLFLAASLICCSLFAEVSLSGLSDEEVQNLKLQAEKMRTDKLASERPVEKAKQYVEIGQMIGQAMAASAKEMNIAVNDFAQSPVGKVTVFLVVWKFFGRELVHIGAGSLFLIFGLWLWNKYYRKMCIIRSVEYEPYFKIFRRVKSETYYNPGYNSIDGSGKSDFDIDGTRMMMVIILAIIVGVSQLIMWTY